MKTKSRDKWQFGDFQTPDELAQKAIATLQRDRQLQPDVIIEPTCGKGAFIRAALDRFPNAKIFGADINPDYVSAARRAIALHPHAQKVEIAAFDFFCADWDKILAERPGYLLIVGNPPWVTSSELSVLNSQNLPSKSNFQQRRGIEAMTGAGNFDISEWMLLQHANWLSHRDGTIALLCKYSVARKVMRQIRKNSQRQFLGHIYPIDTKLYFAASVDACWFVLSTSSQTADCNLYESLDSATPTRAIGDRNGITVSQLPLYEQWQHLTAQQKSEYVWRSGVKHDCAKVMELEPLAKGFKNGLGEIVELEWEYLYPLLKSSDVGNGRTRTYRKVVLIPQTSVGADTSIIRENAPKTWQYLCDRAHYLAQRKSSLYQHKPPYSIFGVGAYTFKPWKIAISGLYKRLEFCLVGPLAGKAVLFDDTVNFLAFETEAEAQFIWQLLTSEPALAFLNSIVFWDEKRPIAIAILKQLSLKNVAAELGVLEQYLGWHPTAEGMGKKLDPRE